MLASKITQIAAMLVMNTALGGQDKAVNQLAPRVSGLRSLSFARAERVVIGGPWVMQQAWLKKPQSGFKAGMVRFAWEPDALWILADLPDECVATRSAQDNENLWELGDVFEVFVEREGAGQYQELHVSPANHRLHLVFPRAWLREIRSRTATLDDFKQSPVGFESKVRSSRGGSAWQVLMRIPANEIYPGPPLQTGQRLKISFSRYDRGKPGSAKILSSTSPHREPNFHRRKEWRLLILSQAADSAAQP